MTISLEELMSLPVASNPKTLPVIIPAWEVGNGSTWTLADDYNY